MPGKTVRSANQSRLAKHRMATQEDIMTAIFEESLNDITFGIIQKHNGNGQLSVILPDKKEARAVLRGLLGKCNIKNVFPTGSIVVLGIREFESRLITLDVMGHLERKDAKNLVKANKIPAWMLSMAEGSTIEPEAELFEFDYENEADSLEKEKELAKKNKEREKSKDIDRSNKNLADGDINIDDI